MKLKNILSAVALACAVVACSAPAGSNIPTNKKEVMDQFVAGTLDPSYVPAAFFIHFGSDQKVGEPAIQAQFEYFLKSNMDILKIQFEQSAPKVEGLDTEEGWDNIPDLPVDFYQPTLDIVKRIQEVAGKNVYVLPTVYNPHQVALQSIGRPNIVTAASKHPEAYKKALDSYKAALLWFIDECKKIGIEGFYTCTQGGEMKYYEVPGYFDNFVKPYDLEIMGEANKDTKLNILHICDWEGVMDDLTRYADYPAQIVNTPINLNGTPFTLQDGVEIFKRPMLGGLDRHAEIISASEEELAELVDKILDESPKGLTMLGAECTVSSAPIENIQRAIYVAHHRD